eukprot:CAMPEP_0197254086 /NCGR_PEP_ID=MMETSP1429-20130617/67404_1 /TAXON_ID=49237 /ORGANISM="Chaetoceros  sp., Strain UNC1202" /LENGTH=290 /DNA_ID=CAMNT_0042716969 /DNA_START=18 /DNA_END=891 /DNA_ORIENTATION=-
MSSDIPEANPYLERRQAKIARNESRLEELGLDGRFHNASCQAPTSFDVKHEIDDNSSDKKKEEPTRRSLRLKKIPAEEGSGGKRQRVEVEIQKNRQDRTLANPSSSRARIIKQSEPKPGTTRATEIDLQKCLYGAFDYPVFIGRRLAKTGKLAVIENANIMCENPVTSFNKYSGVCEFKNDVRFLFANINAPDSDIRNEFLNNGGQFTWFGGSRMREESESIQKLISMEKNQEIALLVSHMAHLAVLSSGAVFTIQKEDHLNRMCVLGDWGIIHMRLITVQAVSKCYGIF